MNAAALWPCSPKLCRYEGPLDECPRCEAPLLAEITDEPDAFNVEEVLGPFDGLLIGDAFPVWYSSDENGDATLCLPRYRCPSCQEPLRTERCTACSERVAQQIEETCARAPKGCVSPMSCGRGEPCRNKCTTWRAW